MNSPTTARPPVEQSKLLETLADHTGWITTIGTALLISLGATRRWLKRFFLWCRRQIKFKGDVMTRLDEFAKINKEARESTEKVAMLSDQRDKEMMEILKLLQEGQNKHTLQIEDIRSTLYNGGHNGLVNIVASLGQDAAKRFTETPRPQFRCDGKGANLMVSDAYLRLVGCRSEKELKGRQWNNIIFGEHKDSYLTRWDLAAGNRETFLHPIHIQDPVTGDYRGEWMVEATPVVVDKYLAHYEGRFIRAIDETATRLVLEHGWDVTVNPELEESIDPFAD